MRDLVATSFALLTLAAPAFAETHMVKMLNRNETGGMVYDRVSGASAS
jgi:hypothetical protein